MAQIAGAQGSMQAPCPSGHVQHCWRVQQCMEVLARLLGVWQFLSLLLCLWSWLAALVLPC